MPTTPPPDPEPNPSPPITLEPAAPSPEPALPVKKRRAGWTEWAAAIMILILLTAIAIPNFVKARTTACKNACIANLKQIDGAVQQWALENKKKGTDGVATSDILDFLKGSVLPICPAAGTYWVRTVSAVPRCTVGISNPGHTL
jgi:hypothetical protein